MPPRFDADPYLLKECNWRLCQHQEQQDHRPRPHIAGLYVHVPFCFHKCHYCDFYSIVDQRDRQVAFTKALIAELAAANEQYSLDARTVFVGGGTPTLLAAERWVELLNALRATDVLTHVAEFTIEANPETVTAELMQTLVVGGVSRLSIGAQSFDPALLKTLERWHEPASVGRAVALARDAGIDNLNLDLIFAIPGQTLDQLDRDLDRALALEPEHLSCYSLIFEPGTPLTVKKQQGKIHPIEESLEAAMYQHVIKRLAEAGYQQYEISNWAKPGRPCQHNLIYWQGENYLGIGPSASSFVEGRRWKNQPHLGAYLASPGHPVTVDHETLDPEARLGEQLMLRLRLTQGIGLDWLSGVMPADDRRRDELRRFQSLGLIEETATHLRLTPRGLLLADAIASELL